MFDIVLLEAIVNGLLLGGLLALLALGLNLIFGVIDVTWICYAELIMIGMYGMYYLVSYYHLPYWGAAPIAILLVAGGTAVIGLVVFLMGQKRLEPTTLAPDRTIDSLSADSRMVKETLS